MDYQHDPFFQYPATTFTSSEGDVQLPILYYDTSDFVAMFWVDFEAAASVIQETDLDLVRYRGNKALAALAFFEYRNTTVGVYNEVVVALAVLPKGEPQPAWPLLSLYRDPDKRQIGLHIIDLPVTTQAACAAGREIWGYPKFVTPISFEHTRSRFEGRVEDPESGESIVALTGKPGLGLASPPMSPVLYSRSHADVLLRAVINVRGWVSGCLGGSMKVRIGSSQHGMAQRLRSLGLQGAAPFLVQHTDAFQSRMNAGAPLPNQQQSRADVQPAREAA